MYSTAAAVASASAPIASSMLAELRRLVTDEEWMEGYRRWQIETGRKQRSSRSASERTTSSSADQL